MKYLSDTEMNNQSQQQYEIVLDIQNNCMENFSFMISNRK